MDYYTPIIDNNVSFTFNPHSTYIVSNFDNVGVFSSLAMEYGNMVFHQKEDSIYTVFSLNSNGLCYVFIEYIEGTGISWYIKDVIEYPSDSIDQIFYHRIFTMDYPDQIINRQLQYAKF
jgi:hypothetical protein